MTDTLQQTETLLADLIAIPTISADSNLEMIALLADRLGDCGAQVDIMTDHTGSKANLLARLGPNAPGGIMLSGHSDVVPVADQDWTTDPFKMTAKDDRLFGRGTCDMKGFIAACVTMAPVFAARSLSQPLYFAFTYDEEVGCLGARNLTHILRNRDIKPDIAIIGEPTQMRLIQGHKGCCEYTTRFTGAEGHGSRPDLGVNALDFAVRYASRLSELGQSLRHRAPPGSQFEPPWTTINIGRLQAGHVHNVIPGLAEIDWEMRPVQPGDREYVRNAIDSYARDTLLPEMRLTAPGASIERTTIGEIEGLAPTEPNPARDLVAELTGANGADLIAFGTEAGLFQSIGMSAIVCGPGAIEQAHKPDEYISRDQLAQCLAMLDGLADKIAQ